LRLVRVVFILSVIQYGATTLTNSVKFQDKYFAFMRSNHERRQSGHWKKGHASWIIFLPTPLDQM